jgi:hypothetical protein
LTIGNGFVAGDTLNFTNQNGITGAYNSDTGALTLSGTSSLANYVTALESITFSTSSSIVGNRAISWTVSDGSTQNGTAAATSTVDVTNGPVVTAGGTATYDSGGPAAALDLTLVLNDLNSTMMASTTVSIASGFLSGDTLNFTNQNGITGTYSSSTGVLTLTGIATIANYQTALDSITYGFSASSGDPTDGYTDLSRTIDWLVNDGSNVSQPANSTLNVVFPPTIVSDSQTVTAGPLPLSPNIFTVTGAGITEYRVWFSDAPAGEPAIGQVTDNGVPIALDQWVTLSSLAGLDYVGSATAGTDDLWLQVFDGQWSPVTLATLANPGATPPAIVATNQTVAFDQSVALSSIFAVTGGGSITSYNIWLNSPADGEVTNNGQAIATNQSVNVSSLSGVDYAGGPATGSDTLWLQAVTAQGDGNWVAATLTDTGAITASNQTVAYDQSVALSSIFTVSGGSAITGYNVWLDGPADGTVTTSAHAIQGGIVTNVAIATNESLYVSSLSGVNYVGGPATGSDTLWLQAVTAQGEGDGNWVAATLTDTGAIVASNQTVAYDQSVALSSIFAITGGGSITSYNIWLNSPADGEVSNNGQAIATNQSVNMSSLSGVDYVGGPTTGTDVLWLQAVTAQGTGTWVEENLTDTGAVTAANQTVAYSQSVALSSIFTISGGGSITSYNIWLDGPSDGEVSNNSNAIVTNQSVNVPSLSGVDYVGGPSTGSDTLWLQAVTAQGTGTWVKAIITDQSGANDTLAAGSGNNVIYMGGTDQTLLDGSSVYNDTVVGFSEASGDSIHLTTDTVSDALAHSTQINSGADTLITLSDTSTILLKGITSINSSFFS